MITSATRKERWAGRGIRSSSGVERIRGCVVDVEARVIEWSECVRQVRQRRSKRCIEKDCHRQELDENDVEGPHHYGDWFAAWSVFTKDECFSL